jgi:predicted  nucleic acid-binding Zn-ribbon protein
MKALKMTKRQADLVGESVLKKIKVNRQAVDMITNDKARNALYKEIDELNEILMLLTQL